MSGIIVPLPEVLKSEEKRLFDFQTIKNVFDPSNLLILFANLLAFVLLQTTFFWFVASRNVEQVLEDKSVYVSDLLSKRGVSLEMLRTYLDSDEMRALPKKAEEQREMREQINWELLKTYIMPVVIALVCVLVLIFFSLAIRRQPLTSIDLFLLFLVLGAFSTELYFYLTVTSQLIHLGDSRVAFAVFSGAKEGFEDSRKFTNRRLNRQ